MTIFPTHNNGNKIYQVCKFLSTRERRETRSPRKQLGCKPKVTVQYPSLFGGINIQMNAGDTILEFRFKSPQEFIEHASSKPENYERYVRYIHGILGNLEYCLPKHLDTYEELVSTWLNKDSSNLEKSLTLNQAMSLAFTGFNPPNFISADAYKAVENGYKRTHESRCFKKPKKPNLVKVDVNTMRVM